MKGLKDKAAVVTGGASGIGLACVRRLCQEGVSVAFSDLNPEGKETEARLRSEGFDVQFVHGDMSEEDTSQRLVKAAADKWGRVDFLINNAFSFLSKGVDATRDDWDRVMHVGPVAYAAMAKYCMPYMIKAGKGAIVNISSISAHITQPNRWTYNSAKGAVKQLTKCMAMDLAPKIRVNSVSPAWTWTQEVAKAADNDLAKWEPVWGKFHLLRRLATVDEVAAPTVFLLSDDASFITGTDLFVDGGYLTMGSEGLGENSSFVGTA